MDKLVFNHLKEESPMKLFLLMDFLDTDTLLSASTENVLITLVILYWLILFTEMCIYVSTMLKANTTVAVLPQINVDWIRAGRVGDGGCWDEMVGQLCQTNNKYTKKTGS